MHPFVEKVINLPCWEGTRRDTQIQPPHNNGEAIYAVIASILVHGGGDPKLGNKLRLFAAQYNINFTRQRELFEIVSQSGWDA